MKKTAKPNTRYREANKTIRKIVIFIIAATVLLTLCSCGASSKLVGSWVLEDYTSNYAYPEQMTLRKDGTGIVEGFSCNWTAKDGVLVISYGTTIRYDYHFSGSKLYLDDYAYTKTR